jgi:hypothetical protein
MNIKTLSILAIAAGFVVLVVGGAVVVEIQPSYAEKKNDGCRDANCQGVNGNQNSNNDNEDSFNFYVFYYSRDKD